MMLDLPDSIPGDGSDDSPKSGGREPISPAKRRRLQQSFERANQLMSQENWDYANELFGACIAGDPGNLLYLQSFLVNLKKKYSDKKGSKTGAFMKRRTLSKAAAQSDWDGVIKNGCEVLKLNPWDVTALVAMANAVQEMGYDEVELAYLKMALEADPKNPDVNRLCAIALRSRKRFDEAIICWHRVEQAKPGNEEAAKEIARLAVEKTIDKGGYEETDTTKKTMPGASVTPAAQPQTVNPVELKAADLGMTPLQKLERDTAKNPKDVPKLVELAKLYLADERYDRAEEVLQRAAEASDNETSICEQWEDARIRRLRHEVSQNEIEVKKTGSEEAKQHRKKLRKKLNDTEMEVYKTRCERYPTNMGFRYDLGVRHQLAGQYNEAIAQFQQARNEPRRRGACMLALGQCFQKIKQSRLAMTHYESAVEEISDREENSQKLARYLASKLAIELKDLDRAEKHLTALAERDFMYKDVPTLLEKIAELREQE